FQEVWIPTRNRKRLYGWWLPQPDAESAPALILIHGWGRNVERMLPYLQHLSDLGLHLVAFDARHHGSSDPDGFASMLKFAQDIQAVIRWLGEKPEVDSHRLGLVGLSIGGAASLYAAALEPRVKAVVTVGAFADPVTIMDREFRQRHIPRFPLPWLIYRYFEWISGQRISSFAPLNNMGRIRGRVLLVHGTEDATVPYSEAERLLEAGDRSRVELWTQEGYGHSNNHEHPEFWERLRRFLTLHIVQ
ncbi:MAG: alpha/beta fold hydrolase, partial [Candidatus Neomarinimicrobiota bacterium]